MQTLRINPVVVPESDFPLLKRLASTQAIADDEMSLKHEIQRAIVVKNSAFPANTVRLDSSVKILNLETQETSVFTVVIPKAADIRSKKVSVLSPMGTALIGFREGDLISWKMPRGMKHFKILEVDNSLNDNS